jgi:hypothetical protein
MESKTKVETSSRLEKALAVAERASEELLTEVRAFREPLPDLVERRSQSLAELSQLVSDQSASVLAAGTELAQSLQRLLDLDAAICELARLYRTRLAQDSLLVQQQQTLLRRWRAAEAQQPSQIDVSG